MDFLRVAFPVVKTLEQFAEVFGPERMAAVSRELTKKFEQTVRGTLAEVADYFREHTPKGEFVIVVRGFRNREEYGYRIRRRVNE